MSKIAAIDAAIRLQLADDGKSLGLTEKVDTAYVDAATFKRFLLGVAHRLRLDTPARRFDWASIASEDNRKSTLLVLSSLIEEKTVDQGAA